MKWDDEARARVAGMKRAGMTTKQIAERMGVTPSTIGNMCSKVKAYSRLDHSRGRMAKSRGRLMSACLSPASPEELTRSE